MAEKQYKLLKDLPGHKAGEIVEYDKIDNFPYFFPDGDDYSLSQTMVEEYPDWFQPLQPDEPKITSTCADCGKKVESDCMCASSKEWKGVAVDCPVHQPIQPDEEECDCCGWDDMGFMHEPTCSLYKEPHPSEVKESV